MTIEYRKGDVLEARGGVLIHSTNTQGVMGAGIAAQIKHQDPKAWEVYNAQYEEGLQRLGTFSIAWVADDFAIANINAHGARGTDFVALSNALSQLRQYLLFNNPPQGVVAKNGAINIFMPRIGTGIGGADWGDVERVLEQSLPDIDFNKICYDYEPQGGAL